MAGTQVQGGKDNLIEGKWFWCAGSWLFPNSPNVLSALLRVKQLSTGKKERTSHFSVHSQKPVKIRRQIQLLGREIQEKRALYYNAQPRWSLSDILLDTPSEALDVVDEFLGLVKFAAAEFCWTMNRPGKGMEWKRHSWKHTTFEEIERIVHDVEAGHWLPPQLTLDIMGSHEQARELFRKSLSCEPEVVARVDSLFPSPRDKATAARHALELGPKVEVPYIRSAADLAAEYADVAIRFPDSLEASKARSLAKRLFSKSAAKGSWLQGGRPPSKHHEETITTIWMMCYAMSRQLREIERFLGRFEWSNEKRRTELDQSYPSVFKLLHLNYLDFLDLGNTQIACKLAGSFLNLSASKIEKVVYRRRSVS